MSALWESYGPACVRILHAFEAGEEPQQEDLAAVRSVIARDMTLLGADNFTVDDVVGETLLRVLSAVRSGRVRADANVAGYFRVIARHCAIDLHRIESRLSPRAFSEDWPPETPSDDEIAAHLDALATREDVIAALRAAIADGKSDTAARIAEWLVVAERTAKTPSLRDAADQISGASHSTIKRALDEFAPYLQNARDRGA